jgi:multidrug efflux pump
LGIAVVGGLIFSGFLTLYLVPAIYSYLSAKDVKVVEEETTTSESTALEPA